MAHVTTLTLASTSNTHYLLGGPDYAQESSITARKKVLQRYWLEMCYICRHQTNLFYVLQCIFINLWQKRTISALLFFFFLTINNIEHKLEMHAVVDTVHINT